MNQSFGCILRLDRHKGFQYVPLVCEFNVRNHCSSRRIQIVYFASCLTNDSGLNVVTMKMRLISCVFLSITAFGSLADLLVVTREDTEISILSRQEVSDLWLKKSQRINQINLTVIDIKEKNPDRSKFYHDVLGMTNNQLKAYWAIEVFRGNGFPPDSVDNREAVKIWVAGKKGRLGYMTGTEVGPTLKIIFRMED